MASGDYLCLIGDDDSVNPDIFKLVRFAIKNNIESIVPIIKSVYLWPDTCRTLETHKNKEGLLTIYSIRGELNYYKPMDQLKLLLQNGAQNYQNYKLPKLYHGIIRKDKMDEIKRITGHYLGGLSPDIYAAVSLCFFIDKVYYIDFPLTIPGICSQSTSGEAAIKKTIEKLEDSVHFRDRGKYDWTDLVPKFYSDENIWADSAIAALLDLKNEGMLKKFNLKRLTVILLKKYINRKDIILDNYFNNLCIKNKTLKQIYINSLFFEEKIAFLESIVLRVILKLKSKKSNLKYIQAPLKGTEITDLGNILEATKALKNYLSSNNISIDHILKRFAKLI
jgi:hypothetical protein